MPSGSISASSRKGAQHGPARRLPPLAAPPTSLSQGDRAGECRLGFCSTLRQLGEGEFLGHDRRSDSDNRREDLIAAGRTAAGPDKRNRSACIVTCSSGGTCAGETSENPIGIGTAARRLHRRHTPRPNAPWRHAQAP